MAKGTVLEKVKKETGRRNASKNEEYVGVQMTEEQLANYRAYQKKFIEFTYRQYSIRFRADSDADVIAYLDDEKKVPNLTNMLRRVVLAEIYKDDPREKDLNGRPIEVAIELEKKKMENSLKTKQQIGRGL